MLRRIYILLMLVLVGAYNCRAAELKDQRLALINARELLFAIHQTPLASALHVRLLSRASNSGLVSSAYSEYSLIWRSHLDDPNANLWRGMAALAFWSTKKSLAPKKANLPENPFEVARTCLAKAYQLMPSSSIANMEYGFFLWQYDNQESKGLALLQRAKQIAFTDPRVHAYLALVYCNRTGNSYNLSTAKDELQIALKIDNSYAFAHRLLSSIYRWSGQRQLSQLEEKKYLSLIPQPKRG